MHPRSRHKARYDLADLSAASPELAPFLRKNPSGEDTVDFADPKAVKALNRALLKHHYGVSWWDIPEGYLCPPVPGRADYVHHLADLLGPSPRGAAARILDIGVGANCVYPLIGRAEYGWTFVGSDCDPEALAAARRIVDANGLGAAVELRLQASADKVFDGVVRPGERFDAVVCNPPFHASLADARAGSARKARGLGKPALPAPELNFGGKASELVTAGGELGFARRMAAESARFAERIRWFTLLVSKAESVDGVKAAARKAGATEVRVVPMGQGNKVSRLVAWTFGGR